MQVRHTNSSFLVHHCHAILHHYATFLVFEFEGSCKCKIFPVPAEKTFFSVFHFSSCCCAQTTCQNRLRTKPPTCKMTSPRLAGTRSCTLVLNVASMTSTCPVHEGGQSCHPSLPVRGKKDPFLKLEDGFWQNAPNVDTNLLSLDFPFQMLVSDTI